LFPSLYERSPGTFASLPLMPEWFIVIAALAAAAVYEAAREPLLGVLPGLRLSVVSALLVVAVAGVVVRATAVGVKTRGPLRLRALTAWLHVVQPVARAWGRTRAGLTPWRRRWTGFVLPVSRTESIWCERWVAPTRRLALLASSLRARGALVTAAGGFDRWDLAVRVGPLGSARLRLVAEEHGHGRQMVRFRIWPRWSRGGVALIVVFAVSCALAVGRRAVEPAVVLGALGLAVVALMLIECGSSIAVSLQAISAQADLDEEVDLVDDLLAHLGPVAAASGNGRLGPDKAHGTRDSRERA
jgi:hypothetical protein